MDATDISSKASSASSDLGIQGYAHIIPRLRVTLLTAWQASLAVMFYLRLISSSALSAHNFSFTASILLSIWNNVNSLSLSWNIFFPYHSVDLYGARR